MEFVITIKYDPIERTIDVSKDDALTFLEAFGLLEGAKIMMANAWNEKEKDY